MGIIKKLLSKELVGLNLDLNTEVYPITSAEAVYDKLGTTVQARLDRIDNKVLSILSGEGLAGLSLLQATNYILAYTTAKSDLEAANKLNRSEKSDVPSNYTSINNILMLNGYFLYMTTCRKRGTTYLTYSDGYIWSNPVRMGSGYTTSETGNDGNGYNYIYCRTRKDIMPNIPSGLTVDRIESLDSDYGIDVVNSNIVNYVGDKSYDTWFDHPLGVDKDYPFEWVAIATGSDSEGWSDFTLPVRWSNFGFNGMDGDGVEYIFKLATRNEEVGEWVKNIIGRVGENSTDYYNVPVANIHDNIYYLQDDFIPLGWHDNPLEMTNTFPVLYVSTRKKKWEKEELRSKYLMFSTPKVWTNLFSGYSMTSDNDTAALDDNTVDAETIKLASEANYKVFFGLIEITNTCKFKITRKELPELLDVILEGTKAWLVPKEGIGDAMPTGTYNYVVSAYLNDLVIISKMATLLILDITVDGSTYKLNITNDNWAYTDSGILLSTELSEITVANIYKGEPKLEEFTLVDSKDNITGEGIEVIYPKELEQLIDFENKTIIPNPIMNLKGYDFRMYYKGIIFDSEHIDCLKNGDPGEQGPRVTDTTYYYKCAINTWKPDWNPNTVTGKDAPTSNDTWEKAYTALVEINRDPKADGTYVIWEVPKYTYSDGKAVWGVWSTNDAASKMGTMNTWIGDTGIYSGTIAGDHIVGGTIDALKVGVANLLVGKNVFMAPGAKISWDNIEIPTSVQEVLGGDALNILGSKTSVSNLPTNPKGGDGYFVQGVLYIYSSKLKLWVNSGSLIGPQGPQGQQGPQGPVGGNGSNGKTITKVELLYAISSSNTSAPTTGWSTSVDYLVNKYVWTRFKYYYDNSTTDTAYSTATLDPVVNRFGTKLTYIGNDGIYSGTIACDKLIVADDNNGKIFSVQGNNVTLGSNVRLSWDSVTSKPTIPSKVSDLNNDSQFLTSTLVSNTIANSNIAWSKVTGAPNITYTPRTIYRTASSLPSAPSGTNPSGWSTTPPSTNATKTIYIDFIISAEGYGTYDYDIGYISAVDNTNVLNGTIYKPANQGGTMLGVHTVTVGPGNHSIYVLYKKDGSQNYGDDCFKVKMRSDNLSSGPTYVTSYDSNYPWSLLSDGYYKSSNEGKDKSTSTMKIDFSIPLADSASSWVSVETIDSNGNNTGWSTPVPFGNEGLNASDVLGVVKSYVPTMIDNYKIQTTDGIFYGDVLAKTLRAGTNSNYMKFCEYNEALQAYKDYNGTTSTPSLIGGSGNISGTTMVILIKSGSNFFVLNPLDLAKGASYTPFSTYTNSYTEATLYKDSVGKIYTYSSGSYSLYTGYVGTVEFMSNEYYKHYGFGTKSTTVYISAANSYLFLVSGTGNGLLGAVVVYTRTYVNNGIAQLDSTTNIKMGYNYNNSPLTISTSPTNSYAWFGFNGSLSTALSYLTSNGYKTGYYWKGENGSIYVSGTNDWGDTASGYSLLGSITLYKLYS